ncbi:MAG: molybdopterin-synthase adenylyltransferase MoeB [Zhongshania sp.]|uniref:HesA/MoeB/ThiF family protein n=1 Tax=Zhongshania sp. TaxID=1971902 RepID=UPI002633EE26|nr:molybdopterin-synthase adenylyltransferase MoeB [Zhongshania sp.]MDF1693060.1 molybdopterin-synthase adenylyltransferase MoeB [Zhongshania sp.]
MNDEQLLRYSRHILLPNLDVDGQEALLRSRVLIVGMGGLGCPVAMYLAASGVGELHLADDDTVDLSNLQRQIAHGSSDVGRLKVDSVADSIGAINSDISVLKYPARLTGKALINAVAAVDLVVDASDNFTTRFALNQACYSARKPLVSGAAIRGEGQLSVFDFRREDSPCYRCLYHEADDAALNCAESGVLAPIVGIVGSMQALEALKCLAGVGEPLVGRLLLIDGINMELRQLNLRRDPACPVCSRARV